MALLEKCERMDALAWVAETGDYLSEKIKSQVHQCVCVYVCVYTYMSVYVCGMGG